MNRAKKSARKMAKACARRDKLNIHHDAIAAAGGAIRKRFNPHEFCVGSGGDEIRGFFRNSLRKAWL